MGKMRRGIVVEGRGSQVRVQFDDSDGVISPWLDVAQSSTIGKQSYRRFKKGELVRCYLDRKGESGEALYAIYNDQNTPPADGDDVFFDVMPDGSTVSWDTSGLVINSPSGIVITLAGGKAIINGDVEISKNLKVGGDLLVEGSTDLQATKINGVAQTGN